METAAQAAARAINQTQPDSGKTLERVSTSQLPAKHTDRIFMRLASIYGHKFMSVFPTEEARSVAKAEWGSALSGLSDFQIGQALDRCRLYADWNPSIPEFIRMALMLPSVETATQRVLKNKIVDPVSRNIALMIGGYDLKNKSTKDLEKQIRGTYLDCYEMAVDEMMGKDCNWSPPTQVEHKPTEKEVKRTKEVGEQHMSEIMKKFQGESMGVTNHKPAEKLDYDEAEILAELENNKKI